MIIPHLEKIKNRILNIFAFIVLNIWLALLLLGPHDRQIIFCPGCDNASCWLMWGVARCDLCGYYKSERESGTNNLKNQDQAETCKTIKYYIGMGEEQYCGNKAVATFDILTKHGYPICQKCADSGFYHLSRVTMFEEETDEH